MSRTNKSLKNVFIVLIGQGLGIIIAFIARTFFVKLLGKEYLGIEGLFTNVLTVLALTELGVGEAIVYSLYKPLAEKNEEKINILMNLYRKFYIFIGIFMLIAGIGISPFVNVFLSSQPQINENINLIFLLFVINTAMTYFYSYKKSLLIADQNKYITVIYKYACYLVLNIVQIVILYITHNYYLYLTLMIINTLIENVLITKKVDQMYPYIRKTTQKLDGKSKNEIVKNTKALMLHKIGATAVNSTDNILISKLVGIAEVGMYSNYYLITNAFTTIINQIFNAILASVGNLGVTADNNKKKEIFQVMNLVNFLIYDFITIGLLTVLNPFIKVWIGNEYIFNFNIILVICINFYLNGMRRSVIVFRDALALYWYDRYKPIVETLVNLFFSVILAKRYGIIGILLGTSISTITCCVFIEPYILYKYGFNSKIKEYFKEYFYYILILIIEAIIVFGISKLIGIYIGNNILNIAINILLCIIIPNIINYIIFKNRYEGKYLIEIFKNIFEKVKQKRMRRIKI